MQRRKNILINLVNATFYKEKETKEKLCEFIKRADRLSMGEEVAKFEKAFAKKQGRKYAVMVNSGSSANLILLQALLNLGYIEKGDRVGFSALTWATNVMPIIQLGLKPVPIDCELETLNVSPKKVSAADIDLMFITNVLGFSDDISQVRATCDVKGIPLIEDNCESLGSQKNWILLGNFGAASTFSFYVGHHLSTIEGGMVCTDDMELYEMLVMCRAHGWDRNLDKPRPTRDFYSKYTFYDLSYNLRPTEIQGFLGNLQLEYLDEIINKREENYITFFRAMGMNNELYVFNFSGMNSVSNMAMPVICKDKETFEKYKRRFEDSDVEIRPIIAGDITQQPFFKKYVNKRYDLPNTRFIHEHAFYFPNNPELTEDEVNLLVSLLKRE